MLYVMLRSSVVTDPCAPNAVSSPALRTFAVLVSYRAHLNNESLPSASIPLTSHLPPTPSHSTFPRTFATSSNVPPIFTRLYRIILGSNPNVRLTACCVFALESNRNMK